MCRSYSTSTLYIVSLLSEEVDKIKIRRGSKLNYGRK